MLPRAPSAGVDPSRRVLVVDDDPTAIALCRAAVRAVDPEARVDAARSAEEGVAALRRVDYDLILADMHMARATGIDLLEIAERERPRARRALMTGEPTTAVAHEALLRARIHAFVAKGSAHGVKEALARLLAAPQSP